MVEPAADERGDTERLARMQRGDDAAFDAFVADHAPRIARLVQRLICYATDVDDLVQEVFVRAWQKLPGFRADCSFSTWLQSIAINVCRNHARRQRLWRVFARRSRPQEGRPDDHVRRASDVDLVRAGLDRLSQSDRELLVLRWLEEMEIDEMARLVGARVNTVEVRLHRAKRRLQRILEQLSE